MHALSFRPGKPMVQSGLALLALGLLLLTSCGRSGLNVPQEDSATGTTDSGAGGSPSAASSGSGGSDGNGGSGGMALPPGCWPDLPGPALVKVELSSRVFCMDRTEVTNGDYAAWLEIGPNPALQSTPCTWNDTFVPWEKIWPAPEEKKDHPVAGADWCDADAYCRGAGKRLCRADLELGQTDEWLSACTREGTQDYPYGEAWIAKACNDSKFGLDDTLPVASLPSCEGAHPGLFDLMGNVNEWVDHCYANDGALDECSAFGGSWYGGAGDSCHARFDFPRDDRASIIGFRCCRDAE